MERLVVKAVAEINHLWQEYAAALSSGDMDRWLSLWVEDGIQMPPGAQRRVGKDEIQVAMHSLADRFEMKMFVFPEETKVFGNQAYTHGLYETVAISKIGGQKTEIKGKFLTILRKQFDGTWKIAVECFNYDVPLEIA